MKAVDTLRMWTKAAQEKLAAEREDSGTYLRGYDDGKEMAYQTFAFWIEWAALTEDATEATPCTSH